MRRVGDDHLHVTVFAMFEFGAVDLVVHDLRGLAADGEVERAVEQLGALEAGGGGDAVDGLQDRVDLLLVGFFFLGGQAGIVGGLADQ